MRHVRARDAIRESAEALSRVRVSMCLIPASSPLVGSPLGGATRCSSYHFCIREGGGAGGGGGEAGGGGDGEEGPEGRRGAQGAKGQGEKKTHEMEAVAARV